MYLVLILVIAVLAFYLIKSKSEKHILNKESDINKISSNEEIAIESGNKDVDYLIIDEDDEDDDLATVVIKNVEQSKTVKLINESNGSMEMIKVGAVEYTIGRLKKEVDFQINDSTVSRKHAALICKDNKLYVRDLGSKNKVYVNKREIAPGKFYEIRNNYSVKFGNIEYTFEIGDNV